MTVRSACLEMITYSGSHVAQFTAEQGEDMILQHELHLVLINFFLCKDMKTVRFKKEVKHNFQHSDCIMSIAELNKNGFQQDKFRVGTIVVDPL